MFLIPDINDKSCEKFITSLQEFFYSLGYKSIRYSETKKFFTTSYDAIDVMDELGNVFTINITIKQDIKNPYSGQVHKKDEVIKFASNIAENKIN